MGNWLMFLRRVVSRSLAVMSVGLCGVREYPYQYSATNGCCIVMPKRVNTRFYANKYCFYLKCRWNQNVWTQKY